MANIEFERVTKRYGDGFEAVRDMSLAVRDSEFMILVGPSGSGKSTALRIVAGLEDTTDGALRIGGEVVNDRPPKDRSVAMVFQSYGWSSRATRCTREGELWFDSTQIQLFDDHGGQNPLANERRAKALAPLPAPRADDGLGQRAGAGARHGRLGSRLGRLQMRPRDVGRKLVQVREKGTGER